MAVAPLCLRGGEVDFLPEFAIMEPITHMPEEKICCSRDIRPR